MGIVVAITFFLIVFGFGMTPTAFMLNRPRLAYTALSSAFLGFSMFCLLAVYGATR